MADDDLELNFSTAKPPSAPKPLAPRNNQAARRVNEQGERRQRMAKRERPERQERQERPERRMTDEQRHAAAAKLRAAPKPGGAEFNMLPRDCKPLPKLDREQKREAKAARAARAVKAAAKGEKKRAKAAGDGDGGKKVPLRKRQQVPSEPAAPLAPVVIAPPQGGSGADLESTGVFGAERVLVGSLETSGLVDPKLVNAMITGLKISALTSIQGACRATARRPPLLTCCPPAARPTHNCAAMTTFTCTTSPNKPCGSASNHRNLYFRAPAPPSSVLRTLCVHRRCCNTPDGFSPMSR